MKDPTNSKYNSLQLQCYEQRKEIDRLHERIKRLEDIIEKASEHFRSAGPNAFTAHEMANVLKEAKP